MVRQGIPEMEIPGSLMIEYVGSGFHSFAEDEKRKDGGEGPG